MSLSFNVDPKWTVRNIVGQGIVEDGIGPFSVCEDHFLLSFSSGMEALLKPPAPVADTGPVSKDTPTTGTLGLPKNSPPFWFSLMKARPVLDGLFVSTLADKGSAGVPLAVRGHGAAHTAFIDVRFDRHTFSSIKVGEMVGTYDASTLRPLDSTIRLVRPCARRTGAAASPRAPACSASPHALPRTPDAPRARRGATHRRASGMPTPCSRPSSNR